MKLTIKCLRRSKNAVMHKCALASWSSRSLRRVEVEKWPLSENLRVKRSSSNKFILIFRRLCVTELGKERIQAHSSAKYKGLSKWSARLQTQLKDSLSILTLLMRSSSWCRERSPRLDSRLRISMMRFQLCKMSAKICREISSKVSVIHRALSSSSHRCKRSRANSTKKCLDLWVKSSAWRSLFKSCTILKIRWRKVFLKTRAFTTHSTSMCARESITSMMCSSRRGHWCDANRTSWRAWHLSL